MSSEIFCYCIDANVLINITRLFPRDLVPEIWRIIDKLIQEDRIIAPVEVEFELEKKDDDLSKWAKDNSKIFVEIDEEQQHVLQDVLSRFPSLADEDGEPPHADPWIIALAIRENDLFKKGLRKYPCAVLSDERFKPHSDKIPNVCQSYGIKCFDRLGFWRKEKELAEGT